MSSVSNVIPVGLYPVYSVLSGFVIVIGSDSTLFPEHRQICLGQKRADGSTFEVEMYRVVGSGMPISFEEQSFAVPELAMKLSRDETEDRVATIRAKRGVSA